MEILSVLLVLLFVTRVFGEVAVRLRQPALVGELLAGIALGALIAWESSPFRVFASLTDDPVFIALVDLGVFFLMLFGGLGLRTSDLAEVSGKSFLIAAGGLVAPAVAGFGLAWGFLPESSSKVAQCLFIGTALAITAVPVSIRVLMDLGQLETRVGKTIVTAAIIDDILGLILLAFLTGLISTGGAPDLAGLGLLAGKIVVFFTTTMLVRRFIVPHLGRIVAQWKTAEVRFTSLLLSALVFSNFAELLGLHFIVGAFVAGLLFEPQFVGKESHEDVTNQVSAVTLGFLAPIFFASIGMHLDLSALTEVPVFVGLLILTAVVAKLLGAGSPAYLLGFSKRAALGVGFAMSSRGAVELIVADIALRAGLFLEPSPVPPIVANLFSSVVIIAVVTTFVAPIALRRVFPRSEQQRVTDFEDG